MLFHEGGSVAALLESEVCLHEHDLGNFTALSIRTLPEGLVPLQVQAAAARLQGSAGHVELQRPHGIGLGHVVVHEPPLLLGRAGVDHCLHADVVVRAVAVVVHNLRNVGACRVQASVVDLQRLVVDRLAIAEVAVGYPRYRQHVERLLVAPKRAVVEERVRFEALTCHQVLLCKHVAEIVVVAARAGIRAGDNCADGVQLRLLAGSVLLNCRQHCVEPACVVKGHHDRVQVVTAAEAAGEEGRVDTKLHANALQQHGAESRHAGMHGVAIRRKGEWLA
mmetsp:Transcript_2476/g.8819  ORF Transcript_2476/g.8819 Transcript_2476/m.8819 type:complete len:279 (+) Transcript_2476:1187-2023(+)